MQTTNTLKCRALKSHASLMRLVHLNLFSLSHTGRKNCMIINSSQKDIEVFRVALVTYKLMIICEINDPSAKNVNLKKNLIIQHFGLGPSSGIRYLTKG